MVCDILIPFSYCVALGKCKLVLKLVKFSLLS